MCTGGVTQKQDGQVRLWATGFDDAVKILHYMGERTKAKLLAELVNTEPKLAASLCERLKQINEVR
jgi:flagellar motility protein MotE (MotC chaperone)